MLPPFRIRLFGRLQIEHGDNPVSPLESSRATSLLGYLLLHCDAPQSRQHLAFLLWPDSEEPQARTNLRHLLHTLRHTLPEVAAGLTSTQHTLQWRPDAPTWLDVTAFDAALSRSRDATNDQAIPALREAIALYRGDLLEGVYDEWVLNEREARQQLYEAALERLVSILEATADTTGAIDAAEHLLRHDPLHEGAYQALMRLHSARGDRARAARVYHACAATLERELGIEPSAETHALYLAALASDASEVRKAEPIRPQRADHFVGRSAELQQLASLWQATLDGRAQVAVICGEAGIGKTRLAAEFRTWCAARGMETAWGRAYPAEGELAFGPLVAWLRSAPVAARLPTLDQPHVASLSRLLPELLTTRPEIAGQPLDADINHRQRLFDAATAALALGTPRLLVLDDLHWCDQETLEFLHYLVRTRPDAPLLVLATARHEEITARPPLATLLTGLRSLECLAEIHLDRLSLPEVAELAAGLAGTPLTTASSRELFGATEGNPLFVVEAIRAGWTGERTDQDWITPRVQTVIESRLARLSLPARELVGLAATIGREFTAETLLQASGCDDMELVRSLDELWRWRIIRDQGTSAYDFSHDLIREVAYRSLSPALRRHHHLHVARALEMLHEDAPAAVSGQIAAHYDRAGALEPAIAWYQQAANAAIDIHANLEAIRLLERGITLLRSLPRTDDRIRREITLLTALHAPLGLAEGFSSPRLAEAQQQALALAAGLDAALPSPVLRSLAIASLARGNFTAAREFGDHLLVQGERTMDNVSRVEGSYILGIVAFWQGRLEAAQQHFSEAIARYQPADSGTHIQRYGLDPRAICLSRLANTLWFLGFPDKAEAVRDEALALAQATGHPATRATVWVFAAFLALDMDDIPKLRQFTALLAPSRREREGRPAELPATAFASYLALLDGRPDGHLDEIENLLDEPGQADHAPGMRASIARILIAARAAAGDPERGLMTTERALKMGEVRLWEPEIRRVRAEFLAAANAPAAEIAAEFRRAQDAARERGAVALIQRIAASERAWRDGAAFRHADARPSQPSTRNAREERLRNAP